MLTDLYIIFSWEEEKPKGGMLDKKYTANDEETLWTLVADELSQGKIVNVRHNKVGHVWYHNDCVKICKKLKK